MKKHVPTLLATLIPMVLYSSYVQASLKQQCMIGIPQFERPIIAGEMQSLPVQIDSNQSTFNYPSSAIFSGDVRVLQGNKQLVADYIEFEQVGDDMKLAEARTITASGNIVYDDDIIKLNGTKAWSNLNNKDADIYNASYHMVGRQGRGDADKILLRNNRYVIMQNGSFTSCLPSDNSWSIVGSEIIQDNEEQVAEVWNAWFKIGSVPVFYSPYLQFPTGNKRRSGLLIPTGSYSNSNGLQLAIPYYWNIAPNYDATFTPNFITDRGILLQNEFRYLFAPGRGLFQFDWLPNDRDYSKEDSSDNRKSRWLAHWQHWGVIDKIWRSSVNVTKVSDNQYFKDIDSLYGSSTDSYNRQNYSLGFAVDNLDATLQVKQFQILSSGVYPYTAEPQLDMNYYLYGVGPLDFQLYGQFASFNTNNKNMPTANRFHIEPTVALPIANRWGALNSEVKLRTTHYKQDIPDVFLNNINNPRLEKSVTRTIPQFKINGTLIFDRNDQSNLLSGYTQTLEPRVQYLYIPNKNQSNIHSYDSTLLQSDYAGLFRDRQYSGLDRIASANQLSAGLTSRFYDNLSDERFNISLGQIYYLRPASLNSELVSVNANNKEGSLVWAGDAYWKYNTKISFRGGIQYDDRLDSLALGDAVLEYRKDSQRFIQLNYRYASRDYISVMVNNWYSNKKAYQQDISQLGVAASWPINDNWAAVGAYYFDPDKRQTVDSLVGLQYNTCCWGSSVSVERKIVGWNRSGDNKSNYDNKISFNIELRGLSPMSTTSTDKMLRTTILPYQRAF